MDDLLPSDVAFSEFLANVSPARARRDLRPRFTGWEASVYRTMRPPRRRAKPIFEPTPEQLRTAMASIRDDRDQKAG